MILFFDVSGSMSGSKLTAAKEATKAVIDTLSNKDFVGIVAFNNTAQIIGNNFERSTTKKKEELKEKIEKLSVGGGTNYKAAFE